MLIPAATTTSGPRQHYLPASVIGRFGPGSPLTPARDRKVWVLRRNSTITRQTAATVAYQNNLYATDHPNYNPDSHWSYYEPSTNPAIDALTAQFPGPYSTDTWVHVAEYITANFARTPDFPANLADRLGHRPGDGLDHMLTKENANGVRFLEFFRVSAAIARARWTILHSPSHPLILNDRGATAMQDPNATAASFGYVIPLRPNLAAALQRGPHSKPILWIEHSWRIAIPAAPLTTPQAESLNTATWHQCRREVYASNPDELHRLRNQPPLPPETHAADFDGAVLLGLDPAERMDSELILQNIAHGIPPPPDPTNPPIYAV